MPSRGTGPDILPDGLAAFLAASPDGQIVLDRQGAVAFANEAACRQLGSRDHEVLRERAGAAHGMTASIAGFTMLRLDPLPARPGAAPLATLSHEIRTPLNGILGMAELLAGTRLDGQQRRFVATLRDSAQHLLGLVNDVLDMSKLEAGRLELDSVAFDLVDVAESAAEMLAPQAHAKGLVIGTALGEGLPAAVTGDPARLRQILANLIGNAVKFTAKGTVILEVAMRPASGAVGSLIEFAVRDTGEGIPSDVMARLFEDYVQADASIAGRCGGTGLGLAISRRLARLMGGDLTAESIPGSGSRFVLSVPLKPVEGVTREALSLDGLRVLVVSASGEAGRLLALPLSARGAGADLASGVEEALEALREANRADQPYDLLLADEAVQDRSGLELAEAVLADPALRDTRMMLASSVTGRDELERAIAAGFDHCLSKPVRADVLANWAHQLVRGSPWSGASEAVSAQPSTRPLRILLAEDNATNRLVAVSLLQKLGHSVEVVENGRQAVDAVEHEAFDVVLMDMMMPVMDGLAAAREIRRLPGNRSCVPMIAFTAGTEEVSGIRAAGLDAIATKPITLEGLDKAIRVVLPNYKPAADPLATLPKPAQRTGKRSGGELDRQAIDRLRLELGHAGLVSLLDVFLQDTRERIAELGGALGDPVRLSRVSHALKSAAATVGLHEFAGLAASLEKRAADLGPEAVREILKRMAEALDAACPSIERARRDAA